MSTVVTIPVWGVVLSVLAGGLIGMVIVLISLVVMNRVTMVDTPGFVKGMEQTTKSLQNAAEQYQELNNKLGGAKTKKAPPKPRPASTKKPSRPIRESEPEPEPDIDYSGVTIQALTEKQYRILASRAEDYEAYRLHEAADLLGVADGAVLSWVSKKLLVGSRLNGEQYVSAQSLLAMVNSQGAVEEDAGDAEDDEEYLE